MSARPSQATPTTWRRFFFADRFLRMTSTEVEASPSAPQRRNKRRKSSKKTQALAHPKSKVLPGSESVDEALWTEVAEEITGVVVKKKVQESNEIGKILLDKFFDGKIANFKKRGASHQTFLALARGCSLSPSYLRYAIMIHDQLKSIRKVLGPTDDVGEYLSVSIHRKLTVLKDPELKANTALHIYNEGLDLEQATAAIDKARREYEANDTSENKPKGPGRGRKAYSDLAKRFPMLVKTMSQVLYGGAVELEKLNLAGKPKLSKLSTDVLEGCNEDKIAELRNGVETLTKMSSDLEALRTQLSDVLERHNETEDEEA